MNKIYLYFEFDALTVKIINKIVNSSSWRCAIKSRSIKM